MSGEESLLIQSLVTPARKEFHVFAQKMRYSGFNIDRDTDRHGGWEYSPI
jgi:hypothetical protein